MASIARLMRSLLGPRLPARSVPKMVRWHDTMEEEDLPGYSPQRYYPVNLGDTFRHRYQIILKLGYGARRWRWLWQGTRYVTLKICTNGPPAQAPPAISPAISGPQDNTRGSYRNRKRGSDRWRNTGRRCQLGSQSSNLSNSPAPPLDPPPGPGGGGTFGSREKNVANTELEILRCIATKDPKSKALQYLRTVLTSFKVAGPDGTHVGLVYELMRESLPTFQSRFLSNPMSYEQVQSLLKVLLTALDYLHTKCHIIHTDLKPDSILLGVENQAVIEWLVRAEAKYPSYRMINDNRTIYRSLYFGEPRGTPGPPKIADFKSAVWGDVSQPHNHRIQADLFQAPEVILRAGWTYSADIWSLGVMIWDLLEKRPLFDAVHPLVDVVDPHNPPYSPKVHLMEMTHFLGPPPQELLKRGERTSQYFTAEGKLLESSMRIPYYLSLWSYLTSVPEEDKPAFFKFIRRMLRWMPEDRATAGELLKDPWLIGTFERCYNRDPFNLTAPYDRYMDD